MKNPDEYERRVIEEADEDGVSLWPPGSEYKKVVSWTKFHGYWKHNFPEIKIREKGADTCSDCMIFRNEFRSLSHVRRRAAAEDRNADNAKDRDNDMSSDESCSDMDIRYGYQRL